MDPGINMLIIDEDLSLYDVLKHSSILDRYNIYFSDTADDMLKMIKYNDISVIISDIKGDADKARFILDEIKKYDTLLDIIIVGDPLPSEEVIEIINLGAKDYLEKPLQLAIIHKILREITDKKNLRRETFQLERKLEKKYIFHGIIGKSPYMLEIFSLIEKIAKYFSSILITGETGTGKEMIARSIHEICQPVNKELVICDCTSIPENLFESSSSSIAGFHPHRTGRAALPHPALLSRSPGLRANHPSVCVILGFGSTKTSVSKWINREIFAF